MNLDDMTIGQAKQLAAMFSQTQTTKGNLDGFNIGKKVIIRTYSAGVWFGELEQKAGNEVILKNARRLWYWHAKKSISLSAVANYGINESKSKIAPAVDMVWLEAIEIIPTTEESTQSIEGAKDAKAE